MTAAHIHKYERSPHSNTGNCHCGLHYESHRHPHPYTQASRSNTCVCAKPADAPIHTDAATAQPDPVYPEPRATGLRGIDAARDAIRQARGDEWAPQTPITFRPCNEDPDDGTTQPRRPPGIPRAGTPKEQPVTHPDDAAQRRRAAIHHVSGITVDCCETGETDCPCICHDDENGGQR